MTLSDRSPILDVECRTYGEYAGDMTIAVDPPRKWWQPGPGELLHRVHRKQDHQGAGPRQPAGARSGATRYATESACNPRILTYWSPISPTGCSCATGARRWSCPTSATVDTFDDCGNLFAAGIPINLDRAITDGQLKRPVTW